MSDKKLDPTNFILNRAVICFHASSFIQPVQFHCSTLLSKQKRTSVTPDVFSLQGTRQVTIRKFFTFNATEINGENIRMTVMPSSGRILLCNRLASELKYLMYSKYKQESDTHDTRTYNMQVTCEHGDTQSDCIQVSGE